MRYRMALMALCVSFASSAHAYYPRKEAIQAISLDVKALVNAPLSKTYKLPEKLTEFLLNYKHTKRVFDVIQLKEPLKTIHSIFLTNSDFKGDGVFIRAQGDWNKGEILNRAGKFKKSQVEVTFHRKGGQTKEIITIKMGGPNPLWMTFLDDKTLIVATIEEYVTSAIDQKIAQSGGAIPPKPIYALPKLVARVMKENKQVKAFLWWAGSGDQALKDWMRAQTKDKTLAPQLKYYTGYLAMVPGTVDAKIPDVKGRLRVQTSHDKAAMSLTRLALSARGLLLWAASSDPKVLPFAREMLGQKGLQIKNPPTDRAMEMTFQMSANAIKALVDLIPEEK